MEKPIFIKFKGMADGAFHVVRVDRIINIYPMESKTVICIESASTEQTLNSKASPSEILDLINEALDK